MHARVEKYLLHNFFIDAINFTVENVCNEFADFMFILIPLNCKEIPVASESGELLR